MKDYGAIAEGYFRQGCSCAQSVAAAFSQELGMPEEQVLRMLSGFGAGFGRLREVCGGFSGLTFVISTLYGSADPAKKGEIYAIIQELAGEFRARSGGSLRCKELLGLEQPEGVSAPSPRTADYYASRPCPALVRMGADLCGAYLEAHPVEERAAAEGAYSNHQKCCQ